jgi:hypothetical protein
MGVNNMILLLAFLWSFSAHSSLGKATPECLVPLFFVPSMPASCHQGSPEFLYIPTRVLDWGSNGRGGTPWAFSEKLCNDFFISLMINIARYQPAITLSPHDLFHAHMIHYNKEDLALVIHAKEYPADLEKAKNYYQDPEQMFLSNEKSFKDRNFIYFSADNNIAPKNTLYLVRNTGSCAAYFEPSGINYLSEERLASDLPNGRVMGDLNIFMPSNLRNIAYKLSFAEEFLSAKSESVRRRENSVFFQWLQGLNNKPLFYMLTAVRPER